LDSVRVELTSQIDQLMQIIADKDVELGRQREEIDYLRAQAQNAAKQEAVQVGLEGRDHLIDAQREVSCIETSRL
jgi:hypothetical protein